MKNRIVVLALTAATISYTLVGCGISDSTSSSSVSVASTEAAEKSTQTAEQTSSANTDQTEGLVTADESSAGETITMAVTYKDAQLDEFSKIIDRFTEESGVNVDLITPDDYEATLKTMMAANELPDIWMTHGWSLRRYSEYLKPVNDQPWFNEMDKSLLDIMADKDGNVYALCVSTSVSGIYINKDVLAEAGIDDPYSLVTWSDFEDACEKVKAIGKTPIAVGGASGSGQFSSIFGGIAPTFWTDDGAKYDLKDDLLNGTFDGDIYVKEMYDMIAGWIKKGYFNEDCLTLDFDGASAMMGRGDCAFMLRGPLTIAHANYPDTNYGMLPELASQKTQRPSFRLGEGNAYGVWKDTQNENACWALLSYLAKSENVSMICSLGTDFPAISGVDAADSFGYGIYNDALNAYGDNLQFDNLFDRKYLPNGMWSIIGDSLSMVFDNPDDTQAAVDVFNEGYSDSYAESISDQ